MITLSGPYTSALTHFAGLGLAAILEDAGQQDVVLRWSEETEPKLHIDRYTDPVAAVVHRHARHHADPASWVQQDTLVQRGAKKVDVGLFSPRIAAPENAQAWQRLYAERRRTMDSTINHAWLDGQMLQAIGEPAYWQFGSKNPQYDEGASRWEMKTRNRGEDFVRNRLSSLASVVAERDPVMIEKSLTAGTVDDSAGKVDSRTGTGLVPPGPVDDSVAWCALWGISAFRLFPRLSGVALTPGAWPTDRVHPTMMALPMYTTFLAPAKLRRVLRSEDFSHAAFGRDGRAESIGSARARERLSAMGVRGVVKFPIRKAGSASAPERQVLSGTFEPF